MKFRLGKTVLLELAILRLIRQSSINSCENSTRKTVYIAPLKALCEERFYDWEIRLKPLNLKCLQLTGDSETSQRDLNTADIILTTPEKWDSMTRHWSDNKVLMTSIGLILIDEVHLLNESRGACLEGLISRCKMIQRGCKAQIGTQDMAAANMRFIALSATVPNHQDVAEWLDGADIFFGEEFRPVPLEYIVQGFGNFGNFGGGHGSGGNPFLFDTSLNKHLFQLIVRYSQGRPSLIFCSTRYQNIF